MYLRSNPLTMNIFLSLLTDTFSKTFLEIFSQPFYCLIHDPVNRLLADAKFLCNLVLVHTFIKVKLKDLRLALSQLAHGCIQASKFPVCQHLGIVLIQKIHHDCCRPVRAIAFQGHIFSLSSTIISIVLHPAFPFHEQTDAPLSLLKSLSRHYLICTICEVI